MVDVIDQKVSNDGILQLCLNKLCTDQYMKKNVEGTFLDETYFPLILRQDCDIWIPNESSPLNSDFKNPSKWKLLLQLRTKKIKHSLCLLPKKVFFPPAQQASSYRGVAAGPVRPELVSPNVKKVVSPHRVKSKVIFKDGRQSSYTVANKAKSLIVGYFDKPKLSERHDIYTNHKIPCRTTAFTEKNWNKWEKTLPFFRHINQLFKQLNPNAWHTQYSVIKKTPQFQIANTIFSTVTINHNWRTACHKDSGDFPNGYSAFTVIEYCQPNKKGFNGCFLGYPQFGVAVDVHEGDILIKNPHEWHCNTPIQPPNDPSVQTSRLSFVCYYRNNIQKCIS